MGTIFWLAAGGVIAFLVAVYAIARVRQEYQTRETLSGFTVILAWIIYISISILVLLSAWYSSLAFLNFSWWIAAVGLPLLGVGIGIAAISISQFNSIRRMSGQKTDQLITSGIYQYSRNPQNVGWFLTLLGNAVIGASTSGVIFTIFFFLVIHYYIIKVEEPFLHQLYGKRYTEYQHKTARYWGTKA